MQTTAEIPPELQQKTFIRHAEGLYLHPKKSNYGLARGVVFRQHDARVGREHVVVAVDGAAGAVLIDDEL